MLARLKRAWFIAIGWYAAKGYFPGRMLAQSGLYFYSHYFYVFGDFRQSGEAQLLERLGGRLKMVFDVGCNHGDWLIAARAANPDATIHGFEIVPATYAKLKAACPNEPELHNFGLGSRDGSIVIHSIVGDDGIASAYPMDNRDTTQTECRIRRGEDFCAERGITHIDMMKIDVEGQEGEVLRGLASLVSAGEIDVIQFEYGELNIAARFLLADFYDMLGPQYDIGLLKPGGVEFRPYEVKHETFIWSNYVAVLRSKPELRRLVQAA